MDKFFIHKSLILYDSFAFFFLNFYDVDKLKFFHESLKKFPRAAIDCNGVWGAIL